MLKKVLALALPVTTTGGKQRMLQTEHAAAFAIHNGTNYMIMRASFLPVLLSLERNTGECILGAEDRLTPGGSSCERFPVKTQVSCADGATYNARKTRGWLAERRGWTGVGTTCEIHYVSGTFKRANGVYSDEVSGMIRCCLSLSDFAMLDRFRTSAANVLISTTVIVDGRLSPEAVEYRQLVIATLLPRREDGPLRIILEVLAPGDWRNPMYEWLRRSGETLEDVVTLIIKYVVPLFWGHAPFKFPRERWTGHRRTLKDIGLPNCVHDMGRQGWQQFMEDLGEHAPAEAAAPTAGESSHREGLSWWDALMNDPMINDAKSAEPSKRVYNGASGDGRGDTGFCAAAHVENKAHKNLASKFHMTSPGPVVLGMTTVCDPMASYMDDLIDISSSQWAVKEQAKMASTTATGVLGDRKWPCLEAALMTFEDRALDKLDQNRAELAKLACLPMGAMCVDFRHNLFTSISIQGARVYELKCRHKRFPFRTFRLLRYPAEADQFLHTCPHLIDEWTLYWFTRHRAALTSDDSLIEIVRVVIMGKTMTASLENSNASLERLSDTLSCHVTTPLVSSLTEAFLLRSMRQRSKNDTAPTGTIVRQKRKHPKNRRSTLRLRTQQRREMNLKARGRQPPRTMQMYRRRRSHRRREQGMLQH